MFKHFIPICSLILLSGCMTIDESTEELAPDLAPETSQELMAAPAPLPPNLLKTYPEGAKVILNDVAIGHTPITHIDGMPNDTLELYLPGYHPIKFNLNSGILPSCSFQLVANNKQLQDLLLNARVRFVSRSEGLRLEPTNLPVYVGASFVIFDPSVGQDIHFTVDTISKYHIKLRSNTGVIIWFPIITQPLPNNPPIVPNVGPTSAVGTNYFQSMGNTTSPVGTMYGTSSQNVQAPVLGQYNGLYRAQ